MHTGPLLIFDLGNVIVRHDNEYWIKALSHACADPHHARRVIEAYLITAAADRGDGTVRTFFETSRSDMGFPGTYEEFDTLWCCHFSHDEAMEELVADLAARYRVVVLSNTDDAHWRYLMREYPVLKKPQALYASFQLHLRKPDPAIYQHVLQAEGYAAQDAVFIDDRMDNVEAANSLGINGIHFTGRAALEIQLKKLGVTI